LLADCRGVLGHIGALAERMKLLKHDDSGVLKLAAPPQTIESVLTQFLTALRMVKLATKEDVELLVAAASEMFEETGCVLLSR